jgi:recombinational DNA repair protein RecT
MLIWSNFKFKDKKQERESITITTEEVADIVHYLASDELKGRNTGIEKMINTPTKEIVLNEE